MGDFIRISPSCVHDVYWTEGLALACHPLELGTVITVDLLFQGARDFVVTRVHDDGKYHDVEPVIGGVA